MEQGFDIHRHFEALKKRLKRYFEGGGKEERLKRCFDEMGVKIGFEGYKFDYIAVREKKNGRERIHIAFYGEYIEQALISRMWKDLHRSPIVDIRYVRSPEECAKYLAKYLVKGGLYSRYWMSYNWVFPGWVKWSKKIRHLVGRYPSRTLITGLARVDKKERGSAKRLLEMIWIMIAKLNKDLPSIERWLGIEKYSKRNDCRGSPKLKIKGKRIDNLHRWKHLPLFEA